MDIDKDHIFQHLRMNDECINTTEQKKNWGTIYKWSAGCLQIIFLLFVQDSFASEDTLRFSPSK